MIDKDDPFWEYNEYCKEQEELKKKLGGDYDRFNSPPPPIPIRTLKERLEECKMKKATSVQTIKNVNNISFSIENHPMEKESKLTILAGTDDDVFKFEFEGQDILKICKAAGLFTGWEKDQKIRELEEKLNAWKKEASDCLKLRDEVRREKNEEINKLKKENEQYKEAAERRFKEKLHDFEFNNKKYDGKIMAEILKRNSGRYPWGEEKSPADNVNHPSHYETGRYECIEVMQEVFGVETVKNFCLCNAFKYIWRLKRKNGVEDAKKAVWYLNKYIEHEDLIKVDDIPEVSCDNCKYKWYEQRQEPCKDCNNGNKFVKGEE